MNLVDLFKQLSYGELNNTTIGNDGAGSIRPDKIPTVTQYVNDGLLKLYSQFALKKESLYLELKENITRYHINRLHCLSNESSEEEKYIIDVSDHPYQEDLIKILDVWTSTGTQLPLNNHTEEWSVFTPTYDVLLVPWTTQGMILNIVYQAKHKELNFSKDPIQEINLPDVLVPALRAYVAAQIYSNFNTAEAVNNAQKYNSLYTAVCEDVEAMDIVSNSYSQTNIRFHENGWV